MRRSGLVGLVCLFVIAGLTALGSSAHAFEVFCTGKTKAQVARCDTSGYADVMKDMHWRQYGGHNCTNYVAYRMQQAGVPEPPVLMGNARDWAKNARNLGYVVDRTPSVGAVAHWKSAASHVAYVEEVGDGYLVLSEDSYTSKTYRRYKVFTGANWYPERFIHFLTPGAVPSTTRATVTVSGPAKVSARIRPKVTVRVATANGTTPEGRVRVRRGGVTVATVDLTAASGGSASVRIPRMKRGNQWISAVFDGSGTVRSATSRTIKVVVTKPPKVVSSATTVSVPATSVTLGRRPVIPILTKSRDGRVVKNAVSVYLDGERIATRKLTKRKKGRVAVRLPALEPGRYKIRATYAGSRTVRRSKSKVVRVTVAEPTSVTSSLAATSLRPGRTTSITATVRTSRGAHAGGAVWALVDGERVASAKLNKAARGTATIALPPLAPGTRRVSVEYAGTALRLPSAGTVHDLVVKDRAMTGLAVPGSVKATKRAKVTISVDSAGGVPATSGRVTVLVAGEQAATASMADATGGRVVVTLPRLAAGSHEVTASFGGNDLLEPSVSVVRTLKVTK